MYGKRNVNNCKRNVNNCDQTPPVCDICRKRHLTALNCGKLLKEKLQKFQSRTARVITSASYDIRSADLLEALSWDTLDKRLLRAKITLMYKMLNDDPAANLRNSFIRRNTSQTNYHLRNNATDLTLPKQKRAFQKKI